MSDRYSLETVVSAAMASAELAREERAAELDALRAELAELRRDHADQVELVCKFAAERDALRAEVARLEQDKHDLCLERGALMMERDRLRAALEAAPNFHTNSREQDDFEFKYPHWYDTTRREALDG